MKLKNSKKRSEQRRKLVETRKKENTNEYEE